MQRREFARNALGLPLAAALPSMAYGAALDPLSLPEGGSITDVPGLKVGHYTLTERPTGCTVLICEAGATAGVVPWGAVRGRAAGPAVPVREGAPELRGLVVLRHDGHPRRFRVMAGARPPYAHGLRSRGDGGRVAAVLAALAGRR